MIDLNEDADKGLMEYHPGWWEYLTSSFALFLIYLPVLLFELMIPNVKKRFSVKMQFYALWLSAYLFYIVTVNVLITSYSGNIFELFIPEQLILIAGIWLFILSAVLQLHHLVKKDSSLIKWTKKLSIDHAIILVLAGFALVLSTAVVSDYENFRDNKAVDMIVEFSEIFNRFSVFISVFIQLMIAYLAGYFFYYVNSRFLISKLLKRRGVVHYVLGVAGTLAIFIPVLSQILNWLPLQRKMGILTPSENQHIFAIENGAFAIAVMLMSIPLILVIQWFKQNNEISTLEKEKAQTELNLLKQQINPHFFFNTLNNLYALSLAKSDATPEVVMQLSELMRYVIYKGKENRVAIADEVKYLEDYIQLQQIRLNKTLDLSFEKNIIDHPLLIPPVLLVIFIENAFKHGIEPAEKACFLHMKLDATDKFLYFECINSYEPADNVASGIGLENLKRRLALTYPDQYELTIDQQDNTFKASLKIEFS